MNIRAHLTRIAITAIATIVLGSFLSPDAAVARTEDGEAVVVSLGDSYSSGEGAPPFYGQDDPDHRKGEGQDYLDWVAHRSKGSWAGQLTIDGRELRDGKGDTWYFYASSGAVTRHIYGTGEAATQDKKVEYKDGRKTRTETVELLGQLEYATKHLDMSGIDPEEVDYVTLTIGGNDIGFTGIVVDAVVGSEVRGASELGKSLDDAVDRYRTSVGQDVERAYRAVRDAFPNAHIIVAGYPTLMDDHDALSRIAKGVKDASRSIESAASIGISPLFRYISAYYLLRGEVVLDVDAAEALLVNAKATKFDELIAGSVADSEVEGITYVPVVAAFRGHEAGTEEPFINDVTFGSQPEDLELKLVASAYSMHPNWCGGTYAECTSGDGLPHCGVHAYVSVVQPVIDELEGVEVTEVSIQGKDPGGRAAAEQGAYTYHLDGFDFVLPEEWRGLVEVVDQRDSSSGWLEVMVPGSPYPIMRITDIGSTYSEYGETYDTESFFRGAMERTGGTETVDSEGNTLLTFGLQRPELDGCLLGPAGRSALLEPSVVTDWDPETGERIVNPDHVELVGLLVGNTNGMDARSLDEALMERVAEQIVFTGGGAAG